jgi:hypothetical protein
MGNFAGMLFFMWLGQAGCDSSCRYDGFHQALLVGAQEASVKLAMMSRP